MTTLRSPGYPGISLRQAIDLIKKVHEKNRTNLIDREAAAKDMGFTGMTGSSTKALADLAHFGLIEKAGKGSIRVSQRTVDILYPDPRAEKSDALKEAAFNPALFASLQSHFSDGVPSENALKGYLARQKFAAAVISSVVASYLDTCRLLQEEGVTESHGRAGTALPQSDGRNGVAQGSKGVVPPPPPPPKTEVPVLDNERIIFVDEAQPGHYLKVIASGDLDASLLEALEDFTKRRKKRLSGPTQSEGAVDAEADKEDS